MLAQKHSAIEAFSGGYTWGVRRRRIRPQPRVERSGTLGTDMSKWHALKERQTFVYRLARIWTSELRG